MSETKPEVTTDLDGLLRNRDELKAEKMKLKKDFETLREQYESLSKEKEAEQNAALEEQGKFKKLYEDLKQKYESDVSVLKNLQIENETYKSEVTTFKETLWTKIPDDLKETFDMNRLSVREIQVLASKFESATTPPNSPGAETGGQPKSSDIDVSKMTTQQLTDLAISNPEAYNQYFMTKQEK
jgi:chromosome segregation ATPase